eukprot:14030353-Alexandrium_andersonii.AAC.1
MALAPLLEIGVGKRQLAPEFVLPASGPAPPRPTALFTQFNKHRRVVPQASAQRASVHGLREDSFNVPSWHTGEGACMGCSASE